MSKKGRMINLVIWGLLTVLWSFLAATKIGVEEETVVLVLNILVAVLSFVNFVIHLVFLIRKK
jgi:hypothetical protein